MTPFKTQAHIHSLNGKMDEITVLEKVGDNDYIVDYKSVKCHALFNWFVCQFYVLFSPKTNFYRPRRLFKPFKTSSLFIYFKKEFAFKINPDMKKHMKDQRGFSLHVI